MLSENQKLVYAGNRYDDIYYRSLPVTHFTAAGFFLKTFDRLCVFVFVSFWSFFFFFFFASLHIMKSRKKKKNIKNKNNLLDLQTSRTNTLLCRSFSDYHASLHIMKSRKKKKKKKKKKHKK